MISVNSAFFWVDVVVEHPCYILKVTLNHQQSSYPNASARGFVNSLPRTLIRKDQGVIQAPSFKRRNLSALPVGGELILVGRLV
ncbi:hypothetical protein B9Q11_03120 [Candidatus Marsarchaeota G2 archaeon ECH_B_SAG-F08]|uniref:Uncharacterized protein n=1 Tax=Candidatus Marsarchaeota G2 archaeon ECH_B_SAG-F08 TaxID=1978165 RepID=A0A2R6BHA7_9ARCH|nr:MAG: hypothetical protein B9Q11_03120 [Candidatus Marsarchaeota G2 archaeon ECH_B_SAG-F08]